MGGEWLRANGISPKGDDRMGAKDAIAKSNVVGTGVMHNKASHIPKLGLLRQLSFNTDRDSKGRSKTI